MVGDEDGEGLGFYIAYISIFFFLLLCGLSLGERECTGSTGVVGALSCLDSGGGFGGYMVISFISIVTFISVVNNIG